MNKNRLFITLTLISLSAGLISLGACKRNSTEKTSAQKAVYTCPMHPQYTADRPGDCPICGMRLVLRSESSSSAGGIAGQASVSVAADRQQVIGIKLAVAEERDLFQTVRASAHVAYDPGLYSAILEHREALQSLKKSESTGNEEMRTEAKGLVRASNLRLRQLGLSDEQIRRAGDSGFDPSGLLLGGAGEKVWVYIDLYDSEARLVKAGHKAQLTATAFPGRTFEGTIRGIDTLVNAETRTVRARADVPNPQGDLKPDMYLSAVVQIPVGHVLAVPSTAVMDTGTRQLVYVQREPGQYDPREVTLGRDAGGYVEVLKGLQKGEQVVSSGNFLIDSESKIRGAQK